MHTLIAELSEAVEFGKVDKKSPYPPQLRDKDGALELTIKALEAGVSPSSILEEALIPAMSRVGVKFSENKIFVPQMLMSAKAMGASMSGLKPYFVSGAIQAKGTFIIGTVKGDLHDIGKNLVSMMIEGSGWTIVDLGVDVSTEKFLEALERNPNAVIGLSALLTTTMGHMEESVKRIKAAHPTTTVLVGGAPVNEDFCRAIGADYYAPDPQGAVEYLSRMAS
jgi:methanogenic corrinoid protein MtbC1